MSQLASPPPFTLVSRERFIVEELEVGFAVYDVSHPQPLNPNGFFCLATFDLQLDAFRLVNELNDGEDSVL